MRVSRLNPDLPGLLPSWELHLRAERKAASTIKSYLDGVDGYLQFCASQQLPAAFDRRAVNAFIASLLEAGASPATARSRQLAVRRFSAWAADEGEQADDPLLGLKAPKLDDPIVEPLTDDQLKALVASCKGRDLRERRDEAIVRLMAETGVRAGEVVGMRIDDLSLPSGTVIVRRGKGGKGRVVPVGPQTTQALDRYLRVRRQHSKASAAELWLGDRGKGFGYDALHRTLKARAIAAGIDGFHPHRLRHTAAHRWLAAGGSEGGLMTVAGWTRPDMLLRYTRAQAADRAAREARTLNLGEF